MRAAAFNVSQCHHVVAQLLNLSARVGEFGDIFGFYNTRLYVLALCPLKTKSLAVVRIADRTGCQ